MREESEAIEEANKLKQAGTKIIAVGKNFSAIVSRSTMKKWPHKNFGAIVSRSTMKKWPHKNFGAIVSRST